MLFALLYNEADEIIAAAPACDQLEMGDTFWERCAHLDFRPSEYQTAYVTVVNPKLQHDLKWLGLDDTIDVREVTNWIESLATPTYAKSKAASKAA